MSALTRICWIACLAALISACAFIGTQKREAVPAETLATERQILVTFPDERLGQVPAADLVNAYRHHGAYGNSTWGLKLAQTLADDYGLQAVTQWPISSLGIHCAVYAIPTHLSMQEVLRRLGEDKRIEAVQPMRQFKTLGQTGYSDLYFKLQIGIQAMHVEAAHRLTTGKDITIAVIDTGVDDAHPDLAGQITLAQNFVTKSPETREDVHGTAVAGVIAAANNRQGIVGVAPDAKLLALKACWPVAPLKPEAACDSLSLALDRAITLKPRIINLSLAGGDDPLLERLVKKAVQESIIVVASAGEAGETYFPASVAGVIAVHSTGGGPLGTIAAPGQEILTTLPNGSYSFMSGSSFSAAHVSGLVALLLELKPKLNPTQIAKLLLASMPPPASVPALNTVDVCAALAQAGGFPDCAGPTVKTDPTKLGMSLVTQ